MKYLAPGLTPVECTLHGIKDDGQVVIRFHDRYDDGEVELTVDRALIQGLPEEQTKIAVEWTFRNV